MQLQTKIPLSKSNNQIDYDSKVLLIGSCFVENIGNKLSYFKFRSVQNPFGILFNPVVIENLIANAVGDVQYTSDDVFQYNELWHSFDAHSGLSSLKKEELLNGLNAGLGQTRDQLTNASHVILTLGTAWVYQLKQTNHIVANCHKIPQQEFDKKLLSVSEILSSLQTVVQLIHHLNQKAVVLFTVSPVRHLKDGFVENTRSKSHLVAAIHELIHRSPQNNLNYFPSYELMMDELRDYRFYTEDMIHPNKLAIDYIWEKFQQVWIDENASATMKKVESVQKGLAHRSFNESSDASMRFKAKLQSDIGVLVQQYPHMQF
ncbi:GSCFA domain-containing protein [Spongiivirga citrea]|uniref:GSCFA domain-containing protein n=1 Tax=Spongiivirga citrea TaxID=1481457 RepID=A0A6M0CS46_9FLAO|nr:GSCFA domain-containing protein [Spongiivirga citrea]NER18729.1 GSCFA domain-containing protein [Spongiivirga citrea]